MNPITSITEGITYDTVKFKFAIKIAGQRRDEITTLGEYAIPNVSISNNSFGVIITLNGKKTYVPFNNVVSLEKTV